MTSGQDGLEAFFATRPDVVCESRVKTMEETPVKSGGAGAE